jgi:hypothetical protein
LFVPASPVTRYCGDDCRAERIRTATRTKLAAKVDPMQQWPAEVVSLGAEVARLEAEIRDTSDRHRVEPLRRQLLVTAARLEAAKVATLAAEAPAVAP